MLSSLRRDDFGIQEEPVPLLGSLTHDHNMLGMMHGVQQKPCRSVLGPHQESLLVSSQAATKDLAPGSMHCPPPPSACALVMRRYASGQACVLVPPSFGPTFVSVVRLFWLMVFMACHARKVQAGILDTL